MHPGWAGQAKPAILLMHIRPDQSAFVEFVGCKDMAAQRFFIFLTSGFVRCAIQSRAGFNGGTFPLGNVALTPYKQAIFHTCA
jgi:hypothetical protein